MGYDSILETTAVKVVVDDTDLNRRLQQATRAAKRAYQTQETAAVSASNGAARAARKQVSAQDSVADEIQRNARLAMTLRREYENGIIPTSEEFTRKAENLRKKLFDQAKQVDRSSKAYDRAQLGAQRLSTALATTRGETSKLGLSANVATGTQNAFRQALARTGPAGQAAGDALGLLQGGFAGLNQPIQLSQRSLQKFMGVARALPAVLSAATVAAGALAVAGMARLTSSAAEAAEEIELGAQRTGLAVDTFQELRYAFRQAGIEQDDFVDITAELNQVIGEAVRGEERFIEQFGRLGVAVEDASGKVRSTEAVLYDTIDALEEIPEASRRAGEAVEIFGDDVGRKVLTLVNQGTEGLDEFRESARELGLVVSGDSIQSLAQYRRTVETLKDQFATARIEIAASFVPVLETLVDVVQDQVVPRLQDFGEWMDDFTGKLGGIDEASATFRGEMAANLAAVLRVGNAIAGLGNVAIATAQTVASAAAGIGSSIGVMSTMAQENRPDSARELLGMMFPGAGGFEQDVTWGDVGDIVAESVSGPLSEAQASLQRAVDNFSNVGDMGLEDNIEQQLLNLFSVDSSGASTISGVGGTPPGGPPGASGDGEPAGTETDPVNVKSVSEIARDIRTREGIVDTTLARQAFDPSVFPDEGMSVPVRMAWQSDRDEAIANALWNTRERGAQMSEPSRVGVMLDMEARRGQEAIFNALAGEGGTTEDANRVPVAVDWRSRQDQAIFDALSGGTLFGQGSEPGRVQTMMELQASRRDTVWLNALTGTEGGTTEDPNRVPVALDWRSRQDQAIANALWNTRERDAQMSDDASRVSVTFTPQELRDQAIFDALAGTGGVTGDPSRVPVALDWRSRQDQAIFDALSDGTAFGQTSDSTFSMSVTFDWQELQDQAIFEALSGEGGTTEDPMRVPVALDWRSRQDEAIFNALGAGTAFGQTSESSMFRAPTPLDRVAQDQAIFDTMFAPGASTGVSDPGLSSGQMDAWADAREEAAQAEMDAATSFRDTVISAGADFATTLADAIESGDTGAAVEGLFQAGGSVAANFAGPYGPLVQAGASILGGLFGGLFNDPEDEEDAAARSRRNNPNKFEMNVTMNQTNNFENGATAPDALARSGRDMLNELEEVVKSGFRSVDDRLSVLEERTA